MLENIRLSFQGIFGHKMRSFLTMLGIIIGIAAIIAIVSTIKGTNEQIKENLVGSGNNVIHVNLSQNGNVLDLSDGMDTSKLPLIDEEKLTAIKEMDGVSDAAIYRKASLWDNVYCGSTSVSGLTILGGNNDYLSLEGYDITRGRYFIDSDFSQYRNVAILDSDTAYSFFNGADPINGTIEIKGVPYVVVGVVQKRDDYQPVISSPSEWVTYYGNQSSGFILIPDNSWPSIFSYDQPYNVLIKAFSTEAMTKVGKDAQDYLNGFITTSAEEDDNAVKYKAEDTLEKAKELQKLANATNQQLIWIASISLLVGGIGVMNIMLVSVTERTREIGLKKALGARRGAILGQFLTEAAVLTSLGGIIGVGAGVGLAYLISKVAEVPVAISMPAILVSFVFSMLIGIIFGLLPSVKASKLNPIDALRYE